MKTNKSYAKRLRLTRKGKIVARVPGHNHFNAKRSGGEKARRRRASDMYMSLQDRSRFLSN